LDDQLSKSNVNGKEESFVWDDLALIQRNSTELTNEPYVTGGNPIMAGDKALFNDMLGSTLGVAANGSYTPINRTSFGEVDNAASGEYNFFTGKPNVEGLGYSFLFRNYNANNGKWLSQDPLGYPDGWNNTAYCNNIVTGVFDRLGTDIIELQCTTAAAGFGHSAQIVTWKDSAGNYHAKYYDYGLLSSGSTGCNTGEIVGTNATNVVFRAIQALDPTGSKYNGAMHDWVANAATSQAAANAMDTFVQQSYTIDGHNCRDVLNIGLYTAGYEGHYSTLDDPKKAWAEDNSLYSDYFIDRTTLLRSVQAALKAAAE